MYTYTFVHIRIMSLWHDMSQTNWVPLADQNMPESYVYICLGHMTTMQRSLPPLRIPAASHLYTFVYIILCIQDMCIYEYIYIPDKKREIHSESNNIAPAPADICPC